MSCTCCNFVQVITCTKYCLKMTLICTIFENKEQKIRFHYHNNISLTWGLIIINFIFFFLIFFLVFVLLFFFYLFDTVNDKLSSFYNYLILLKHTCSQLILFSILTW